MVLNRGKTWYILESCVILQRVVHVAVPQVPYTMFSVYDGHAGAGCAVTASNDLWQAVQVAWHIM